MIEYLKNYYVFMLILMVFSYLVPKEDYRKYIQFFVGIFMVVLLLKPILELFHTNTPTRIYEVFEEFNEHMNQIEWNEDRGRTIYENFFLEREGE